MFLIDDANELVGLKYVLEYLTMGNIGYDVKIISTLRDYTAVQVINQIREYTEPNILNVAPFTDEQIKEFLNKHWNSQKKLLKLQELGTIWKFASTLKECDTEVSCFRSEYKGKMEKYEDERTGELTYYIAQRNCPDATLKIPLYATLGKNLIKSDCRDNLWEYAFVFDEKTKKFDMLKINLD